MKIRSNYVSNSSSSSFCVNISKNLVDSFLKDFASFKSYLREKFNCARENDIDVDICHISKRDALLDYLLIREGIKDPSNRVISIFEKNIGEDELELFGYGKCKIKYTIYINDNNRAFDDLCNEFIQGYVLLKNNE